MNSKSLIAAAAVFIFVVYFGEKWLKASRNKARIIKENECKPPQRYPHADPILGLDLVYELVKSFNKGKLLEQSSENFDKYGKTFVANQFGSDLIFTKDSTVVKSVLNTNFANWGAGKMKYKAWFEIVGHGFAILDGAEWKANRAEIRPFLKRAEKGDLERVEKHMGRFLNLIPKDGKTVVNMAGPFENIMVTFTTDYFFGEPVDMLAASPSEEDRKIAEALDDIMKGMFTRILMGSLIHILPMDKAFREGCRRVREMVHKNIIKAKNRAAKGVSTNEKSHRVFLDEVSPDADRDSITSHAITMYVGGAETTASLLTSALWLLSRNPRVFEKLRKEIVATCNGPPGYDTLQRMKYLKATINETLRLYGPGNSLNPRRALNDTFLPRGGGVDGNSPIFVKKGTLLLMDYGALQRDKSAWGDDAEEFRPERFFEEANSRTPWDYQAFGSAPRNCPGQAFGYVNSLYVLARVVQEFKEIRPADDKPFLVDVRASLRSKNGAEVIMVPA